MVNTEFVSDSELTTYINDSIARLIDLICEVSNEINLVSQSVTASGVDTLTLNDSFYRLKGVDYQLSSTTFSTLSPFNFKERNKRMNFPNNSIIPYQWHMRDRDVTIIPLPTTGAVFKVWYQTSHQPLIADSDIFNFNNAWDEWVILDSAIKCKEKEESDVSTLMAERKRVEDIILKAAMSRNQSDPYILQDPDDQWY